MQFESLLETGGGVDVCRELAALLLFELYGLKIADVLQLSERTAAIFF